MAKSKLGNKQICEGCGTRFFDFGKIEIKCPNCGEIKLSPKSGTQKAVKEKIKPAKVKDPKPLEEDTEEVEGEIDDNNIEDDNFILEEMDDYEEIKIEDNKDKNNEG